MAEEVSEAMSLALAEVYHRFLCNLPSEEHEPSRFMVHLEHGYWFYIDELTHRYQVPALKFYKFLQLIKSTYRILPEFTVKELQYQYDSYKRNIPVRGGILLNRTLDKVLLVSNFAMKNYGFPKGKINECETDEECAAREVLEEVGFSITGKILPGDSIETGNELTKLFIVSGVPENFNFRTQTQGEIGSIEWVPLSEIAHPSHRYKNYCFGAVYKFLPQLKKWIQEKRSENPDAVDCASIEYLDSFKKKFCQSIGFKRGFQFDMERVNWKIDRF